MPAIHIKEEIDAPYAATQSEQDFLGAEIARTSAALNQHISQRKSREECPVCGARIYVNTLRLVTSMCIGF